MRARRTAILAFESKSTRVESADGEIIPEAVI